MLRPHPPPQSYYVPFPGLPFPSCSLSPLSYAPTYATPQFYWLLPHLHPTQLHRDRAIGMSPYRILPACAHLEHMGPSHVHPTHHRTPRLVLAMRSTSPSLGTGSSNLCKHERCAATTCPALPTPFLLALCFPRPTPLHTPQSYWLLMWVVTVLGATSSSGSTGVSIAVERESVKALCGEDSEVRCAVPQGAGRGFVWCGADVAETGVSRVSGRRGMPILGARGRGKGKRQCNTTQYEVRKYAAGSGRGKAVSCNSHLGHRKVAAPVSNYASA